MEETAGPSTPRAIAARSGRDDGGVELTAGPSTPRATAARSGRDDGGVGLTAGPSATAVRASGRDDGMGRETDSCFGRDDGEGRADARLGGLRLVSLRQVVMSVQSSCLGQRVQTSTEGRRPRARSISRSWSSSGHSRTPRVWLPKLVSVGWTWMASWRL